MPAGPTLKADQRNLARAEGQPAASFAARLGSTLSRASPRSTRRPRARWFHRIDDTGDGLDVRCGPRPSRGRGLARKTEGRSTC